MPQRFKKTAVAELRKIREEYFCECSVAPVHGQGGKDQVQHDRQQYGHENFGRFFNTPADSPVDNEGGQQREQQRESHLELSVGQECFEVPRFGGGISVQGPSDALREGTEGPSGYDHVIGLYHRSGQHPQPSGDGPYPSIPQFGEGRNRAELRGTADDNLAHHEGEADYENRQKVDNDERPSVVLPREVGELP